MRRIFKYGLSVADENSVVMPKGAIILSLQIDKRTLLPTIWATVDPDAETEIRTFETIGTGHPINELSKGKRIYIGTYQCLDYFVGHVFEITTDTI